MTRDPQGSGGARLLLRVVEWSVAAGAAALLFLNVTTYRDESLWLAVFVLAALTLVRLLPQRTRGRGKLAVLGLVAAVAVGELTVRLLRGALIGGLIMPLPDSFIWAQDEALRFTYEPGAVCGRGGTERASPLGICDDAPHPVPKPAGTFRIVCLGDSTSIFAESFDNLYHQVLSRKLIERDTATRRFEVVNGAISGYNAAQQVALLEKRLLALEPDLIVAAYCLNDPYRPIYAWSRSRLLLLRLFSVLWDTAVHGSMEDYSGLHRDDTSWGQVVTAYHRLAELAQARGIPVVAFVMPVMHHSEELEAVYAQVEGLFRELGFASFDLHSELTDADRERFHVPPDTLHPNDAYHRQLGERLLDFLDARGLVP